MKHSRTAEQWEPSWRRRHSCTWRGAKVWIGAALAGCPIGVSAILSRHLESAVVGLRQVSKPSTALETKLASRIPPAFMMCIVSKVSLLCPSESYSVSNRFEIPCQLTKSIFSQHLNADLNTYLPSVGNGEAYTDSPMDYAATRPEEILHDFIILMENDEELQLNQHAEQVELKAQSVVESFPLYPRPSSEANLVNAQPTSPDTTESSINTTHTTELLWATDESLPPTEMTVEDPQHPTALMNITTRMTETYAPPQNTSLLPTVYNETDSHQGLKFTLHESEHESTTTFPESPYGPHTQSQMPPNGNPEMNPQPSERHEDSQETSESNFNFARSRANYSQTDSSHTQEESVWEVSPTTPHSVVQVKQEEERVPEPVQMYLSTQALKEGDEVVTQVTQTTGSSIRDPTSTMWAPLDGSGDVSQGRSSIKSLVLHGVL